jgi:glucans biosynthesis protein
MHGGAEGSGAPKGNQNALKHGRFTRKAIEERRALRKLMREADKFLEGFET